MIDQTELEQLLEKKLREVSNSLLSSLTSEFESLHAKHDQLAEEIRGALTHGRAESELVAPSLPRFSSFARATVEANKASDSWETFSHKLAPIGPAPSDRPPAQETRASRKRGSIRFYMGGDITDDKFVSEGGASRQTDEEHYENMYELTRAFRALCPSTRDSIGIRELMEMCANQRGLQPLDPTLVELGSRLGHTIEVLNQELSISHPTSGELVNQITLDTFVAIMQWKKDLYCSLDKDDLDAASEIRTILAKENTFRKVAKATNVHVKELGQAARPVLNRNCFDRVLECIDPFIGMVILANALVICLGTDIAPTSHVWTYLEIVFTLIFLIELVIKLVAHGIVKFFTGANMYWNIFDTVVVVIAASDVILELLGTLVTLRNFTLVRLLRFARLTKLVRVLKLKMFKELALMVSGILEGIRVLVWAMVFLGFLLFTLGVLLTQTLGHEEPSYWTDICQDVEGTPAWQACSVSAAHLQTNYKQLFGNVMRSMFTSFRCFTDGCTSVDGSPLLAYIYNTHGTFVVIAYMIVTLFVMFGLFNLIMAIFVENTIDNAKRNDTRRRRARQDEHMCVAQKLQEVIAMFCKETSRVSDEDDEDQPRSRWKSTVGWIQKYLATKDSASESATHLGSAVVNLSLQVSHEDFHKVFQRKDVQQMLDDLDICASSRHMLFEILDANCNGTLEVSELVQGLLKLRGTDSKGDTVAALLAVRSMQQSIKAMETLCLHQQRAIHSVAACQSELKVAVEGLNPQRHQRTVRSKEVTSAKEEDDGPVMAF